VAPFGILMEMGRPTATMSLVCFLTGDCSLYFSTGGGMIGGVGHQSVRTAASGFVRASTASLAAMDKTTDYPRPAADFVRFYLLTNQGVLTAECSEEDLGRQKVVLSPLYFAGQNVITQLRLLQEKQS